MIVDQGLSKGIIITLCKKTIMAKETMTLFQDNVFKWYSLPTKVVSDRGPRFVAKFTQELWKGLEITTALSIALSFLNRGRNKTGQSRNQTSPANLL